MLRLACASSVAVFVFAGLLVVARGDRTAPVNPDAVTLTPVRTVTGDAIEVTVGDIAFQVPQLEFKRNDHVRMLVVAQNGQLGTVFPVDLSTPIRAQDLRAIAIKGKSYSLSIRQLPSSAYYRPGAR